MFRKTMGLALVLAIASGCSGSDGRDGKDGAQGPEGPPGSGSTSASISGAFPGDAFPGSTLDVTISGFATNWDDTTSVDFGSDVTVDSVRVASPTALIATVTVGSGAALGARDITITTGSETLSYASGFDLLSPIELDVRGVAAQGSIVFATIKNLNLLSPFDDTSTGDGLFSPLEFTNIEVDAPTGITAQISSVSPFGIEVALLIDADAPAGPVSLEVLSGPTGDTVSFPNPEAFDIVERTPTALSATAPSTIQLSEAFQSELYTFTPDQGLQIIEISTSAIAGSPQLLALGTTGKFADLGGVSPSFGFATDSSAPRYAVLLDQSGESGYTATITTTARSATAASESSSNDDATNADAVTLPMVLQGASLSSISDEDWFSFDAVAGDIGKTVTVRTFGNDTLTDTVVAVVGPDGSTVLGEASDDQGFHELLISGAISEAGTHYVRVFASDFFDPTHSQYDAYAYIAD